MFPEVGRFCCSLRVADENSFTFDLSSVSLTSFLGEIAFLKATFA